MIDLKNTCSIVGTPMDVGMGPVTPDPEIFKTGRVPVDIYTSKQHFATEINHIFKKVWLNIGRVEQLSGDGSYFVKRLEFAGVSALVIRGKDGEIRAFHNICRHRGMALVWDDSGKKSRFRCPYHAWTYDSSGELAHVPHGGCFPDVNAENSSLIPIELDTWNGFIFINLEKTPGQTLAEYLGAYGERYGGLPLAQYPHVETLSSVINANWKLCMDSQAEGYHIHSLHARTVRDIIVSSENPYTDFAGVELNGPHGIGVVPGNPNWKPDPNKKIQLFSLMSGPKHFDLDAREQNTIGSHQGVNFPRIPNWLDDSTILFPNTIFFLTSNGWYTQQFWPLSEDSCLWEARYYFPTPKSPREHFAVKQSMAFNRDTLMEDIIGVQRQQAMLNSGAMDTLQLGEQELLLRHLAAMVVGVASQVQQAKEKTISAEPRSQSHG